MTRPLRALATASATNTSAQHVPTPLRWCRRLGGGTERAHALVMTGQGHLLQTSTKRA